MFDKVRQTRKAILAIVVLSVSIGTLSGASKVDYNFSGNGEDLPIAQELARYDVPFASPQSLRDATKVTTIGGYDVVAYRFENAEIVGEFSLRTGLSVDEYLSAFESAYGTQPEVVAAVVEIPSALAEQFSSSRSTLMANSPGPTFKANAVSAERIAELMSQKRERNPDLRGASPADISYERNASRAAMTWHPLYAEIEIFRPNSSVVQISQYYYWDGYNSSNSALNARDGWEAEVNAYTDNPVYQTGDRGSVWCPSGYKDMPFAKNYGWTWAALVNTGSGLGSVAPNVRAYADYNDLTDACNRNSLAIGIAKPQLLPSYPSGAQEILISISAPRGTENSGRIHGVVQAVNRIDCDGALSWMALTDCMGLQPTDSGHRMTLAEWRNWTAPPRCWRSTNYGDNAPVTFTC